MDVDPHGGLHGRRQRPAGVQGVHAPQHFYVRSHRLLVCAVGEEIVLVVNKVHVVLLDLLEALEGPAVVLQLGVRLPRRHLIPSRLHVVKVVIATRGEQVADVLGLLYAKGLEKGHGSPAVEVPVRQIQLPCLLGHVGRPEVVTGGF